MRCWNREDSKEDGGLKGGWRANEGGEDYKGGWGTELMGRGIIYIYRRVLGGSMNNRE